MNKTYDVTIRATVTKTLRVEAENADDAQVEAQEKFSADADGTEEGYDEDVIGVEEVN